MSQSFTNLIYHIVFSNVEEVRRYLQRQKEHHQKFSSRDEFIQCLRLNGIDFDERYL